MKRKKKKWIFVGSFPVIDTVIFKNFIPFKPKYCSLKVQKYSAGTFGIEFGIAVRRSTIESYSCFQSYTEHNKG